MLELLGLAGTKQACSVLMAVVRPPLQGHIIHQQKPHTYRSMDIVAALNSFAAQHAHVDVAPLLLLLRASTRACTPCLHTYQNATTTEWTTDRNAIQRPITSSPSNGDAIATPNHQMPLLSQALSVRHSHQQVKLSGPGSAAGTPCLGAAQCAAKELYIRRGRAAVVSINKVAGEDVLRLRVQQPRLALQVPARMQLPTVTKLVEPSPQC